MTFIEGLWWGAFGGFGVEASHLLIAYQRANTLPWKIPGEPGLGAIVFSVVLRVLLGAGLAAAAGMSEQVSGPMGAIAVGVCAPVIINQIGARMRPAIPRNDEAEPVPAGGPGA
ncbi:hypothetical protein [Actinocrispum sp. NPDC049592]|uniref:hypothetical protein n=1 Tax=Actinocrispum sp. NPDC049592 TaxID=3154835 RepID=UPI003431BA2C